MISIAKLVKAFAFINKMFSQQFKERLMAMDDVEFSNIRKKLNKTQKELSHLLGISLKAIRSYEQGRNDIPAHAERQILFLAAMKNRKGGNYCWKTKSCPSEWKANCPAWEFKVGNLCWLINGTFSHGQNQNTWKRKMAFCRKCPVFQEQMR